MGKSILGTLLSVIYLIIIIAVWGTPLNQLVGLSYYLWCSQFMYFLKYMELLQTHMWMQSQAFIDACLIFSAFLNVAILYLIGAVIEYILKAILRKLQKILG